MIQSHCHYHHHDQRAVPRFSLVDQQIQTSSLRLVTSPQIQLKTPQIQIQLPTNTNFLDGRGGHYFPLYPRCMDMHHLTTFTFTAWYDGSIWDLVMCSMYMLHADKQAHFLSSSFHPSFSTKAKLSGSIKIIIKDPIPATEPGLTMQLKSYKMNNLSLDDLPVIQVISILIFFSRYSWYWNNSNRDILLMIFMILK